MVTASKEEISEHTKDFFKLHLKTYLDLVKNNAIKISTLDTISHPDLDAVFIFKFVRAELDHLKSIDLSILDKEVRVFYKGALETVTELSNFKKAYISSDVLFRNHFVAFNDEAKTINASFEKEKTDKSINSSKSDRITKELKDLKSNKEVDIEAQKALNKELADTLQKVQNARTNLEEIAIEKKDFDENYYPIFLSTYKKISEKIISLMVEQVSFFSFSVDRDLWKNSLRSRKIIHFFESIKETGNMNIQKYMEYHLKHQTSSNSQDPNQIKFRKKLIASIEKIKLFKLKEKSAKKDKTS